MAKQSKMLDSCFIVFPKKGFALFGWRDSKTKKFVSFSKVFHARKQNGKTI